MGRRQEGVFGTLPYLSQGSLARRHGTGLLACEARLRPSAARVGGRAAAVEAARVAQAPAGKVVATQGQVVVIVVAHEVRDRSVVAVAVIIVVGSVWGQRGRRAHVAYTALKVASCALAG